MLEQQGGVLEHFNSWSGPVLERFNSVLTPRLLSTRSSGTYTKAALLSNPEPFQAVFERIRGNYEQFQQNSKHFCANLSELSGFESEGSVKGGKGRC